MFIGHIPAGYIITTAILERRVPRQHPHCSRYLWCGLAAAVLPDFDLLYFYLVDNRQHLHHSYWTHLPVYWTAFAALGYCYGLAARNPVIRLTTSLVFANILGHLFLDTVVGKIRWLHPYSEVDFVFFEVPARFGWWLWNFVLHWSFLFEVGVLAVAVFLFMKRKDRSCKSTPTGTDG
jgi:inner membrane protein